MDKEKRVKSLSDEQIKLYGRLIEKIVIGAAKECGLDKNSIVCEDLGTLTNPVAAVMEKYQLQGMRLTQFVVPEKPEHPYRCKNITENVWIWWDLKKGSVIILCYLWHYFIKNVIKLNP